MVGNLPERRRQRMVVAPMHNIDAWHRAQTIRAGEFPWDGQRRCAQSGSLQAPARPPARRFSVPPPATSRWRPWRRALIIPGRSPSCPAAACWSPSGPDACASWPRTGALSSALGGVLQVFASGQGGLLDVVLDRGFAQNHTIYFCYAEPVEGRGRTALARARLMDEDTPRLDAVEVIFRQAGPLSSGNHFGCRIVHAPDGNLFLTTGDHFTTRDQAQNLGNHLGKLIRIRTDGSAPPDNPFVG